VSYLGQDPLVQSRLNGWNRRGADWLALPRLRLFEPNLRLLFECDAEMLFDNAVEVLRGVHFGIGDDFLCPPFSFAAIQGAGTRYETYTLANKRTLLLTLNVFPESHDVPLS
jgi:hypothetical protein